MICCNRCKKFIAVKGIKLQTMEQGEYQVQYFSCPHCGERYQVATTDEEQRRLIAARLAELEKRAVAVKQKFRQKTIERHWRKAQALKGKIDKRAEVLRKTGEGILNPGRDDGGSADNKDGAAKL